MSWSLLGGACGTGAELLKKAGTAHVLPVHLTAIAKLIEGTGDCSDDI